jgi:hypothetical protein
MKRIAIILGVIIDPNHFRLMLEQELAKALGREVKPGDLKLSILSGSVTATLFRSPTIRLRATRPLSRPNRWAPGRPNFKASSATALGSQ